MVMLGSSASRSVENKYPIEPGRSPTTVFWVGSARAISAKLTGRDDMTMTVDARYRPHTYTASATHVASFGKATDTTKPEHISTEDKVAVVKKNTQTIARNKSLRAVGCIREGNLFRAFNSLVWTTLVEESPARQAVSS